MEAEESLLLEVAAKRQVCEDIADWEDLDCAVPIYRPSKMVKVSEVFKLCQEVRRCIVIFQILV
jgi:hypothetical protein